jgi:hypothetical protein
MKKQMIYQSPHKDTESPAFQAFCNTQLINLPNFEKIKTFEYFIIFTVNLLSIIHQPPGDTSLFLHHSVTSVPSIDNADQPLRLIPIPQF